MARTLLTNEQWHKLKIILLQLGIYNKHNLRLTVEGILFRIRTGIPWRDPPKCFSCHNTIYKTFVRWYKLGKLMKLFQCLSKEADTEWVFIDGSYIKAHINMLVMLLTRQNKALVKVWVVTPQRFILW